VKSGPPISGDAATIDSVSSRATKLGAAEPPARPSALELAHTQAPPKERDVAPPTQPVPVAPPPTRKLWPLLAVGALAIAATAGVMFFVMGDDDKPRERVADRRDERREDRRDRREDRRDEKPTPTVVEPAPETPKPETPKPETPKPETPKPETPKIDKADKPAEPKRADKPVDKPEAGNAEMRDLLAEAEAAADRGDRPDALRITARIVNNGSDPRATAEAHVLRGILLCNDITQANGELRQIPKRFPGLIKKLKTSCPALQ
jgi:hypothetical protein